VSSWYSKIVNRQKPHMHRDTMCTCVNDSMSSWYTNSYLWL